MKLKKLSMILLSAGALSFGAYLAHAGTHQRGNPDEMIQRHMDRLKSELNLTSDQSTKIKSIYERHEPEMKSNRAAFQSATSDAEKQSVMQKIRSESQSTDAEIKGVLTSEQATKYNQMISKREQRNWNGSQAAPSSAAPSGQNK